MTLDLDQAAELDLMGPVDYLVVAFPESRLLGKALPLLLDLVDRGIIRILDLAFIRKEANGAVTTLSQVDLARMEIIEAALFEGASSGILAADDLHEAAADLDPGTAAGVLIYENVWAAPFARALRQQGGVALATGRIEIQALIEALDAAEQTTTDSPDVPTPRG